MLISVQRLRKTYFPELGESKVLTVNWEDRATYIPFVMCIALCV